MSLRHWTVGEVISFFTTDEHVPWGGKMSQASATVLERLLQSNGLGWMIDKFPPREVAISDFLERLKQIELEFRTRIGVAVSFSPETLEAEAIRNPQKISAFLQAVGSTRTLAMLVMVWRILQGLIIKDVVMNYHDHEASFSLLVRLSRCGDSETEEYRSTLIDDAALVRHFGITTVSGRPLLEGFFPMRQKENLR
jgi:hypothetical protein